MSGYVEVLPPGSDRTDKDAWLAARRTGIGSSDIAPILGLSDWASPFSIWSEKLGAESVITESERMYWGREHEPLILKRFQELNHNRVRPVGLIRSIDRDWQMASPDALCSCFNLIGGIEVKTADKWDADEWNDTAPIKYQLQAFWQMDTLGADHMHFALLLGGNEYHDFILERDDEIIATLRGRAEAFWHLVQTNTPPPADALEVTSKALRKHWQPDPDKTVILDAVFDEKIANREAAVARTSDDEKAINLVANETRLAMGDAEIAVINGQVVATNKPRKDGVRVLRFIPLAKRKELAA